MSIGNRERNVLHLSLNAFLRELMCIILQENTGVFTKTVKLWGPVAIKRSADRE